MLLKGVFGYSVTWGQEVKPSGGKCFKSISQGKTELSRHSTCADPESCQRGSNFENVFFSLIRGGRIKIPLLVGHQWPASETPFKWRFTGGADDGPTLNAGLVAL